MDETSQNTPVAAGGASAAAIDALLAVLRPLARLAVDHGVQFGQLEELTKRAMIDAARIAIGSEDGRSPVSRLSVITGIHRKEVKRLLEASDLTALRAEMTPASELFTRWVTDPDWREADGTPRVLARRSTDDAAPTFERLARAVTTDVHPRTILDELLRLELVAVDAVADTVRLRAEAFVPAGRIEDLLAFLGGNVGDHLSAARENVAATLRVSSDGRGTRAPFVEQSLFADAISAESVTVATDRARAFWNDLLRGMAPELQRLETEDRDAGRVADHRVRIGVYCYAQPLPPPAEAPPEMDSET